MRKTLSPNDSTSRTLVRGLEILRLFGAQRPVLTQTQIAEELGLPLPTVGRLCRALVSTGFLELRPDSRRLQLGSEIRRLAAFGSQGMNDEGRPWMRSLNEQFDEEVNLAILDGVHALYLDTLPSTRRLGVKTVVGSRAPAHCTAVGKCLLAQLDYRIVMDRLGPDPYEQRTDKTILRWSRLHEELADIRRSGLSRSIEEFELGLAGFAVPLGPHTAGGAQLAVSIAVPTARLQPGRASAIESALLAGPHPYRDGDVHVAD
jgi:DNA-binding IclR family transcriptional regulator